MIDKNLLNWAKKTLSAGYTEKKIETALLKKGYKQSVVNELMDNLLEVPKPSKVQVSHVHYNKFWVGGLMIVLVVAGLITLVYSGKLNLDFLKFKQSQPPIQPQETQQYEQQEVSINSLEQTSETLKDLGSVW